MLGSFNPSIVRNRGRINRGQVKGGMKWHLFTMS